MADQYRKREVIRTPAILTAAYVASDPVQCLEYDFFALLIRYVRGDAGGAVSWIVEYSQDGTSWYQSSLYEADTLAAGDDAESGVQREIFEYTSTGATAELFAFGTIEINQFAKFMRVSFVETGVVGTPGNCGAELILTRRKQVL